MLVQPGRVQFASKEDIINYVSKGLFPPSKKHFNALMNKVKNVNVDDVADDPMMPVHLKMELTREERHLLDVILTKIYANRVRNRNIFIIGSLTFTIIVSALIFFIIKNRCKEIVHRCESRDMGDFTLITPEGLWDDMANAEDFKVTIF